MRNTVVAVVVSGSIGVGLGSIALGQVRHNDVAKSQHVETAARLRDVRQLTRALDVDGRRICDAVRANRQVIADIIAVFTPADPSALPAGERTLFDKIDVIIHRPIICNRSH